MTDHRQVTVTLGWEAAEKLMNRVAHDAGCASKSPGRSCDCGAAATLKALRTALQEGEGEGATRTAMREFMQAVRSSPDPESDEIRATGAAVSKLHEAIFPEQYVATHPHDQAFQEWLAGLCGSTEGEA